MKNPKISIISNIFCILILALLLIPTLSNVQAATSDDYTPLAPLPCIEGNGVDCKNGIAPAETVSFKTYVQYTMNLLIALSAVAAVFMIVWGGLQYMTTTVVSGKGEGLKKVQNAIYGLLLVLCSYLILKTIDPRLVEIPTTLVPQLEIKPSLTQDIMNSMLGDMKNSISDEQKHTALIDEVNAAEQRIKNYEAQIVELQEDINKISDDDPIKPALVAKLEDLHNKVNKEVASQAVNTSVVMMSNASSDCLRTNLENNICANLSRATIREKRDKYIKMIEPLNQPDSIKKIQDYTAYATLMTNVNQQISTLKERLYYTAVVDSMQTYNRVAGTAVGYLAGNKTGAVVGFVAASIPNSLINDANKAEERKVASVVIKSIQDTINVGAGSIRDPELKAIFDAHSQAILKTLKSI
ncbi:MAG: pilin [Candidatus Paceibacterota bacterium]|jgi:hypothetical protein